MKTFGKALGGTILTVVPVLIKMYGPTTYSSHLIIIYSFLVFLASLKIFRPDNRFRLVRNPTLDANFERIFSEARAQAGDSRLPFRVHILQPQWTWTRDFNIWNWKKLVVAYSFGSAPTDPDHGKQWKRGVGLCWRVFESGEFAWYRKGEHDLDDFNLKDVDKTATSHVQAVFCLPLRRPSRVDPESVSPKVVGVLALDALTPEGAEGLKAYYDAFLANNDSVILDTFEYISLYF